MTPEDYLEGLRDHLDIHLLPAEEVAAGECVGRVLARDVAAVLAVPPFTNSAMDGFALDSTALAGEGPWTLPVTCRTPMRWPGRARDAARSAS